MTITFTIPGPPKGKGRPRAFNRGGHIRMHTPKDTVLYELRVIDAWRNAGAAWIDGPLGMHVEVVVTRPGGHFRVNGELSKAGLLADVPVRKPDLDNVLKAIADSLNGHAYKDDAQIVEAKVIRRWANPGERDHVTVTVETPEWLALGSLYREAA